MPVITPSAAQTEYDVAIIGSGAGGGQMAYTLTLAGIKCVMLEAGRDYNPVTETPMFMTGEHAPLGGSKTPDKDFGFYDATVDGGWDVPGEPYTQASDKKEDQFWWWRARMMGGRTNHWGRISLRNGPYDFKPRSRDGLGFDWPVSYEEIDPYYTKVEMLIGVYGTNSGMENTPDSPEGVLLPPPKGRLAELFSRNAFEGIGEFLERFCHGAVEHHVAIGRIGLRAERTEFELVAREGKGARAVAVGVVLLNLR